VVGCGFFPDAVVGRELFFLPWPSLENTIPGPADSAMGDYFHDATGIYQ